MRIAQEVNEMSVEKKKILYVQTNDVDTPERAYAPFILATTAVLMNVDATVCFVIHASK